MLLSDDDLDMVWVGAFRYYLGRCTISVSFFTKMLSEQWGSLPERSQQVILKDLKEAILRDDADRVRGDEHKTLGHDCDSVAWRELYSVVATKC